MWETWTLSTRCSKCNSYMMSVWWERAVFLIYLNHKPPTPNFSLSPFSPPCKTDMSPPNLHLQKYSIVLPLSRRILIWFFSIFSVCGDCGHCMEAFPSVFVVNYSRIGRLGGGGPCPAAEMDSDSRIHQRLIWKPGRCSNFDSFCLEPVGAHCSALYHTPPPASSIWFKQTPFWLEWRRRFGGI